MLKLRSLQHGKAGDVHSQVADLVNSHGVGLRHQNLRIHADIVNRKKKSKNESFQDLFEESTDQVKENLEFVKPSFPQWLDHLPHEWTIVQITESWSGKEALNFLGGRPCLKSLPDLTFVRFPCGKRKGSLIVHELDKPVGEIAGGGLLTELDSILEGNTRVGKDFRGNLQEYWKVKEEHHNRLKVM